MGRAKKHWATRAWNAAKPYAKTGLKLGVRMAQDYARNKTQTRTIRVAGRDFGGVTTQHDARTIYRAKKMPYRKKKKWVAFTRKVKAVAVSDRAKSTLVINTNETVSVSNTGQAWTEAHLYSVKGTALGTRDMDILLEDTYIYKTKVQTYPFPVPQIENPDPSDLAREDTRKELLMSSGSLDLTYTNTGTIGIEMDLYTVMYSRQSQGTNGGFLPALATNFQYVSPVAVYVAGDRVDAPNISYTDRGVSLFDVAYGMSRLGCKIIKKEKFFIAPGNSITKNVRDPKNHNFRLTSPDEVFQHKKLTQSYVACYKTISLATSGQMQQKWTRTYKYTYEGGVSPHARYVSE